MNFATNLLFYSFIANTNAQNFIGNSNVACEKRDFTIPKKEIKNAKNRVPLQKGTENTPQ